MSWLETWKLISSDIEFYSKGNSFLSRLGIFFFSLPFQTLALYRLIRYTKSKKWVRPIALWLSYINQRSSGCHIHHLAVIGKRLSLPHPTGIVIGAGVHIGDDVTIYQNVTIGSHGRQEASKEYPYIDDNVTIFAGAVIVGKVHLGRGAKVGANSVVISSVPAGVTVAGIPAIPISRSSYKEKESINV